MPDSKDIHTGASPQTPEEYKSVVEDLERTKSAMINLLEDIEHEKSLVEEKVLQRTKELSEEHARFLISTNSLPLGLVVFDVHNEVLISNPAVKYILKIPDEFVTFAILDKALHQHFDIKSHLTQCIAEERTIDMRDIDLGKSIIRVYMSPMKVTVPLPVVLGVVMLIEDVTEQRLLERSREEFFAIASHELRTPLTAIRGNMSMIQDFYAEKITDPDVLQMIGDTATATTRLIKIVNDFLDMSRLEQSRIKFKSEEFSGMNLAEEVTKELAELAAKKHLTLDFKRTDNKEMVVADRDRSKQVLVNMVANAINYSQKGTITVRVEDMAHYVKFTVSDQGVGMTTQNQGLLFKKFQQAGDSVLSRDVTQGTGLGLYISKLIIESMGGTIALERSAPGEGSTFSFTLRSATHDAPKADTPAS